MSLLPPNRDLNKGFVRDRDLKDYHALWIQLLGFKPRARINELKTMLSMNESRYLLGSTEYRKLEMKLELYEKFYDKWIKPPKLAGTIEEKIKYADKLVEFWQNPVRNLGALWFYLSSLEKIHLETRFNMQSPEYVEKVIEEHKDYLVAGEYISENDN